MIEITTEKDIKNILSNLIHVDSYPDSLNILSEIVDYLNVDLLIEFLTVDWKNINLSKRPTSLEEHIEKYLIYMDEIEDKIKRNKLRSIIKQIRDNDYT